MSQNNNATAANFNPWLEAIKRSENIVATIESLGTPKSLDELIRNEIMIGPMNTFEQRLKDALVDYLNQRFCVAILRNPDEEEMLLTLKNKIVRGSEG